MSGPKDAGSASQGLADRSALLASIKARLADDAFQVAGDQLLFVLAEDVPGAADMARQCAQVLRERDWDGDPELAEQIEAALGQGPVPALRPLPVNLADLSDLLEADLVGVLGRAPARQGPRLARRLRLHATIPARVATA